MLKTLNPDPSVGYSADVRAFVKATGTKAVVLWGATLADLEPEQGQLDLSQFAILDEQAPVVLADGLRLLIALECSYPAWACTPGTRVPADLSPSGPWASYIELVMRRYPKALIIVLNEPNFNGIPADACAEMMKTAAAVAKRCGCSHFLAPANAGKLGPYTGDVLKALGHGWTPPAGVTVGWAIHPYDDVQAGSVNGIKATLDLLAKWAWHAGPKVWCTEGGYLYKTACSTPPPYPADPATWSYVQQAADEHTQLAHVRWHYDWSKQSGKVECWANYELTDSLWSGWASGFNAHDDTPHPLAGEWADL
jgi:hypothetical protein